MRTQSSMIRSITVEPAGNQEQLRGQTISGEPKVRRAQVDQAADVSRELIRAATPMMLITRLRL